jgi:eukaryotic-like serine/threonine-protein kinase
MTPERWRLVKDLFDRAAVRDESLRAAFLDRECADDAILRREVEAMLASDSAADAFMERPAAFLDADLLPSLPECCLPTVGSVVAHYRVVSELGAGGMGCVFLAEDRRLGRKVALKVLAPEWVHSQAARARFEREAQLASALDHPNICAIYDIGHAAGVSFIAMQYLAGDTLQQLLRHGSLSIERQLSIATQMADALAAAHARGIVHRDVKPSNVIVSAAGRVHVLDFGIAKLLESVETRSSNHGATNSGVILGSPSYLSPEQARGTAVDHRTDIFSLGAVLYEMATGQVPFPASTSADTIAAILTQAHVSAGEVNPALPATLVRVIDRALAKDPDDRYGSMVEMRADLQRVEVDALQGSSPVARAQTLRTRDLTQRPFPRWLMRRIAVFTSMLACAAALVGVATVIPGRDAIDTIAVLPFGYEQDAGNLELLADGIADGVIGRLAELPTTRVIARSTTFSYKGRAIDPRTVGRDLGVRAVLTGDVVQNEQSVVIRVELVDVGEGVRLWGNEYRRPISELSAIPRDVAVAVARELRTRLTGEQERRLARDYTRSTEAYQQYLKGRFFWNKRTAEGYTKAIEHFTAAANADPTFALAYSGLADSYSMLRSYGIRSSEEVIPLARAAAEHALRIDGSLAETYASLGKIATDTFRWAEAETAFSRAIDLNANYATAHHWQAMYLIEVGRVADALAAIRRAQTLDPLSLIINTEVGRLLYFARDYDAAVTQLLKTLEMDPNFALAHLHLGSVFLEQGRYDAAMAEIRKAAAMGGPMPTVSLARAYALAGRRAEAEATVQELLAQSKQRFVPPYALALLFVTLGDQERAMDWIDGGVNGVGGGPWFLKVNPPFDVLQLNPRYQAILRRIGLT